MNFYSGGDFTTSENFDFGVFRNQAGGHEVSGIQGGGAVLLEQGSEHIEVDGFILYTVDVREAELRYTALEGHLATFEAGLTLVARTRLGAFVTTGRRATARGAFAPANPLLVFSRAVGRR